MPLDLSAPPEAGISFRAIEAGDDAFLRQLYRNTREQELARTGWDEAAKSAFINNQFDCQDRWYREQYAGVRLLLIERGGAPAGRLYLHETAGELRLMEIALVPALRNRGIGTQLIRWLMASAAREDRDVTLHVEHFNRARSLYERLGFEEESNDGLYVRMRCRPRNSEAVEDRLDDAPL